MTKINIYPYKRPALEQGDYTVTLKQKVTISTNDEFKETFKFKVNGYQYFIPEEEVHAQYPPRSSQADFSNYFPHIVLKQATFPWERSLKKLENNSFPWIALFLFSEDELKNKDVVISSKELEAEGNKKEKINKTTVSIKKELFDILKPSGNLSSQLCYVRNNKKEQFSVVVANRLPEHKEGQPIPYHAHLLSLEEKITGDVVELTSLFSWGFKCEYNPNSTGHCLDLLKSLTKHTYGGPNELKPTEGLSSDLSALLNQGYSPIKFTPQAKEQAVVWYRSPLSPGKVEHWKGANILTDSTSAIINKGEKINDLTYALAFSLGQFHCINDLDFLENISSWKTYKGRMSLPYRKQEMMSKILGFKSTSNDEILQEQRKIEIEKFLKTLINLEKVPLYYIIPHWKNLPETSINFFQIDYNWINYLLKGALYAGGSEEFSFQKLINKDGYSGFLLHSEIVSSYPDIVFEAYDDKNRLLLLRKSILNNSTSLFLFEGTLKRIEVKITPGASHLAFNPNNNNNNKSYFVKGKKNTCTIKNTTLKSTEVVKNHLDKGFHWILKTN